MPTSTKDIFLSQKSMMRVDDAAPEQTATPNPTAYLRANDGRDEQSHGHIKIQSTVNSLLHRQEPQPIAGN